MQRSFWQGIIPEQLALADEIQPAALAAICLKAHRPTMQKKLIFAFRRQGWLNDGQAVALIRAFDLGEA